MKELALKMCHRNNYQKKQSLILLYQIKKIEEI